MSSAVLKLLGNGFVAVEYECPEELHVKEKRVCVCVCVAALGNNYHAEKTFKK